MINNVPSSAFSMSLVPPMGKSNPQLRDALKKLSAAKYGRPRALVEKEIFERLGAGDAARKAKLDTLRNSQQQISSVNNTTPLPQTSKVATGSGSSFLDEWLAKRQQIINTKAANVGDTDKKELHLRKDEADNMGDEVSIKLR